MLTRIPRSGLILALAGLVAVGIVLSEYRALANLDPDRVMRGDGDLQRALPWGGLAGRQMAAALESGWRARPAEAEAFLAKQLQRYPMDRARWYDRANIARHLGQDPERVMAHLEAAVAVQPGHRETRWQVAALAQVLGRPDVTIRQLRTWLEGQPAATDRALFVAGRWIEDADELLDRLLPEGDAYLEAALRYARQHGRMELGRAAWTRLPRPRPPGDASLLDFVDLALAQGHHEAATAAWAETHPDFRPGDVPNADLRHDLGNSRGLDWNVQMPPGSRASRDHQHFVTEPASLRLDFDGRETLHLGRPWVRIPVAPHDGGWVLSGYWRAQGLTTRALPYLSVWADDGRRTRVDVPANTFDWTPFRIGIEGSEAAAMLHLQLRRDASVHHFDRFLAGTLWLDALRLEPKATDAAE